MTFEEKRKVYAALAAPFPEEAIERTDGRTTGRGYSTTGIKYQYVVNRLNEVLGPGCFRVHRTVNVKEITTPKGRTAYEATCDLTLELGSWENGAFLVWAEAVADGGHQSFIEADSRKGCTSAALKKAAAYFGVGKQAYEGSLDDDALPQDPDAVPAASTDGHVRPQSVPPGYMNTATPALRVQAPQQRNRLSSKQLSAIWSIARRLGHEQASFRNKVKAEFGKSLEFLSKEEASALIGRLSAHINGNGSASGADIREQEVS